MAWLFFDLIPVRLALTASFRPVHETTRGPVETGRGSPAARPDPRTHQREGRHRPTSAYGSGRRNEEATPGYMSGLSSAPIADRTAQRRTSPGQCFVSKALACRSASVKS
jgi:hypothetical protein